MLRGLMNVVFSDLFTLLGALDAGIRAFLAMFHVVFPAFLGAKTADRGAMFYHGGALLGLAGQKFRGNNAQQRTIHVELDTPRHRLDIVSFQT